MNKKLILAGAVVLVVAGASFVAYNVLRDIETREIENVTPAEPEDLLADDRIEDKNPSFNPDLLHPLRVGEPDNIWRLNLSDSVIRLDVPDLREDRDGTLLRLYSSYTEAASEIEQGRYRILPSVNMAAGKAKQFDDGLFAALDAWAVSNREQGVRDLELLLRQVMTEVHPSNPAYAWIWGALEVGGFISPEEYARRPPEAATHVQTFLNNPTISRPVGFYNWNEDLQRVFRFLRYLQQPFPARDGIPDAFARVVARDGVWLEQYQRVLRFYARLTNPADAVSFALLADPAHEGKSIAEIAAAQGYRDRGSAYLLPPARNREAELFQRLYPTGVPEHVDLMREFILAIRDGRIDLTPGPDSGWYDHQIFALETFVLPERGPESERLLLTRRYKQRLLEAFKSIVTTTRETHIRTAGVAEGLAAPPTQDITPPLRIEPNPTYYLRTARSYGFLQRFLMQSVGDLNDLYGYRRVGWRERPLGDELELMRLMFFGLYLVSCDDIGMQPEDITREVPDADYCRALAVDWIENWREDPDMAVDTRVAVPVYTVPGRGMRLWCTIGVRPMKLEASFAKPPQWRPEDSEIEWEAVPRHKLARAEWVILSLEQAEVARRTNVPLTRKELRDVCDAHETREAIIKALSE